MIVKGTPGPHFIGEFPEGDPSGGSRRVRRWEGTEAEVKGLIPSLRNLRAQWHIGRNGQSPAWFAEAVLQGLDGSTAVTPVETYELTNIASQLPLLANPKLLESLEPLDITVVKAVKEHLETATFSGGTPTYDYNDAMTTLNAQVTNSDTAIELLDNMLQGVQSYFEFDNAFIWTRSFHITAGISPNFGNAKKVYTSTDALRNGEGGFPGLNFDLPEREWFKHPPTFRVHSEGQAEITYQYWAADVWTRIAYYLA